MMQKGLSEKIAEMLGAGMTQTEIARALGCSRQNVWEHAKRIAENPGKRKPVQKDILMQNIKKAQAAKYGMLADRYKKYIGADMSGLTERERGILLAIIDGEPAESVGDRFGIKYKRVYDVLFVIRKKLDGEWKDYAKERNEYGKEWQKEHPGYSHQKNREYYLAHSEEVRERVAKNYRKKKEQG
jgi:predicted transcriptional regulator